MARELRAFVEQSDNYSTEDVDWNGLKTVSLRIKDRPEAEQVVIALLKSTDKMRFSESGKNRDLNIDRSQIIFIPSLGQAIKEEITLRDEQANYVRLSMMGGSYGAVYSVSENVPEKRVALFDNKTKTDFDSGANSNISASYTADPCSTAFCDGTTSCIRAAHEACSTDGGCLLLLAGTDAYYLSGTATIATACFIYNNFM